MKTHKHEDSIDAIKPETPVSIEVQQRPNGLMLYVHVEGRTILRIGQISEIRFDGALEQIETVSHPAK